MKMADRRLHEAMSTLRANANFPEKGGVTRCGGESWRFPRWFLWIQAPVVTTNQSLSGASLVNDGHRGGYPLFVFRKNREKWLRNLRNSSFGESMSGLITLKISVENSFNDGTENEALSVLARELNVTTATLCAWRRTAQ